MFGGVSVKTLDGFGDVFLIVAERPRVVIPAIFAVVVVGIMNFIMFGYAKAMNFQAGWLPFALTILEWAFVFVLSSWSALLIAHKEAESEKLFSKIFPNLFVFSTFAAFFVVWGIEMYVVPGFFVLFFVVYVPVWMILNKDIDTLKALKGSINFILEDGHVVHTAIFLIILLILFAIPYIGEYLAMFFYVLWLPNVYISGKRKSDEMTDEEVDAW